MSVAQTEDLVQSFLTASGKSKFLSPRVRQLRQEMWCRLAKCPMAPLSSASCCSLPAGVFYHLAPTRSVSWFLPGICWGFKTLLPWGVNLFTCLSSEVRPRVQQLSWKYLTWWVCLPFWKQPWFCHTEIWINTEIHLNCFIKGLKPVFFKNVDSPVVIYLLICTWIVFLHDFPTVC